MFYETLVPSSQFKLALLTMLLALVVLIIYELSLYWCVITHTTDTCNEVKSVNLNWRGSMSLVIY